MDASDQVVPELESLDSESYESDENEVLFLRYRILQDTHCNLTEMYDTR